MPEVREMSEWISVEDRQPERWGNYLCYVKVELKPHSRARFCDVRFFEQFKDYADRWHVKVSEEVTHWIPLPEPPK